LFFRRGFLLVLLIVVFLVVLIVNEFYLIFQFEGSILILASLIFLYGLPAGTLFWLKRHEKQEKKYSVKIKHKK